MGFNGKQQSHSIIGFEFSKDPNVSLSVIAYPCDTLAPANGSFGNYTEVGNCSCASCDTACPAPPVNASIGFFDGFNGALVGIVYGALILFSVIFQLVRSKLMNKNKNTDSMEDELEIQNNDPSTNYLPRTKNNRNINDSGISGMSSHH